MDMNEHLDFSGQQIAQYAVLSLIGTGATGRVYWARDERLRRDVALKVVGSAPSSRPPVGRGLIGEARALSRLNHPNVAGIYDFFTHAGREFIVMEFVPGATLRDVLRGGPLPPAEVQRLGGQMVRGLAAAHAAKVIHQDIKPANLKLKSSGELKILDFGVAEFLPGGPSIDTSSDTTSGDSIRGTVPYMAPERLRGEGSDERSDIFSVGVVLYEMAAGRRPFPQAEIALLVEAIRYEAPASLMTINPLVPKGLNRVVMKALEKMPADRQQTAEELAEDLESLTVRATPAVASATGPEGWWAALARQASGRLVL